MRKLWRHSLGCAMGAYWLSRQTGFQALSHEAFFAGLLHDVGKLFIVTVIESIKRNGKLGKPPSEGLLFEAMASLHTENGHRLMQHWNLPEQYCAVARNHHTEEFDPKDFLLLMVRVANSACNKLGIGILKDNDISLAALPESKLLDLSDVDLAKLEIHLEDSKIS